MEHNIVPEDFSTPEFTWLTVGSVLATLGLALCLRFIIQLLGRVKMGVSDRIRRAQLRKSNDVHVQDFAGEKALKTPEEAAEGEQSRGGQLQTSGRTWLRHKRGGLGREIPDEEVREGYELEMV